jgi:predicted MFS family arabinose efflux permease
VNKLLFAQYPEEATKVFLWAPVAWALIGYFLTGFRQLRKASGDGADCLYLAALLSLVMVVVCLFQIPTAPASVGNPMLDALAMLKNVNYLTFMLIQLVVCGMMQFYFLGSGQFLQDRGVNGKNISAVMGIAQAVQALATYFLLDRLIAGAGFQWTFIIGASSWTLLFLVYIASKPTLPIILFQAFHGLAYVFFVIAGQKFVGAVAPEAIGASAQSLIFIATNGIGLFLGTQLAGMVMEKNSIGGKFQWPKIWAVPLAITLVGAIAFAVLFHVPDKSEFIKENPPQKPAAEAAAS